MDWIAEWKKFQDGSLLYQSVKRDQEESYWSRHALNYHNKRCFQGNLEKEREIIGDLVGGSKSIAEIGCGTGAITLYIAQLIQNITVIDPSPSMLKLLRENLSKRDITNVRILQSKWEESEILPHDIVMASGCIYVFRDIEKAIFKMIQAAKKGIVITSGRWAAKQAYDEVAEEMGIKAPDLAPDFLLIYNVLFQMGIYASAKVINRERILYYENYEQAEDAFMYWLDLPPAKRPALAECLVKRLRHDTSGRLILGPFKEMISIIWYWKEGYDS